LSLGIITHMPTIRCQIVISDETKTELAKHVVNSQARRNKKAFKDKYLDTKTCFENDRETHINHISEKINVLDKAKENLYGTLLDKKNLPDRNHTSVSL